MMVEAGEAWDWTEVAGRLADEQVILRHKNMWNTPEADLALLCANNGGETTVWR